MYIIKLGATKYEESSRSNMKLKQTHKITFGDWRARVMHVHKCYAIYIFFEELNKQQGLSF